MRSCGMMMDRASNFRIHPYSAAAPSLNRLLWDIASDDLFFLIMARSGQWRAGFLLAGGQSSRMGEDKAFLNFLGQTLLDRALSRLSAVCQSVTIIGDPAKFAKSASTNRVVPDIFPGCGPLAAIHAALVHSSSELNLILAVDMPFVASDLLAFLLAIAEQTDAIVTVPRAGRLQPLCAVYRREFSAVAEKALRQGTHRIDATFSDISLKVIEGGELEVAGFSEKNFFNLNTPQDRMQAERQNSQRPTFT